MANIFLDAQDLQRTFVGEIRMYWLGGLCHEDPETKEMIKDSDLEMINIQVVQPETLLIDPKYSFSVTVDNLDNLVFTPSNSKIHGERMDIAAFQTLFDKEKK